MPLHYPPFSPKTIQLAAVLLALPSCTSYPQDPEKTLQKVEHGTLVVGYSENPPWVVKTGAGQAPAGIEPELVQAFARTLHARVQWRNNTEQCLFQELEANKLDLVIAGITDDTPWKDEKVGFTRPFFRLGKQQHVMATIQGENAFIVRLETFLHQREAAIAKRAGL